MIKELIQLQYINFVMLFTLSTFLVFGSSIPKVKKRQFLIAVIIAFIMAVESSIEFIYANTSHTLALKISASIGYIVSAPVFLPIIKLSESVSDKVMKSFYCLSGTNAILSIISIFNGCIFTYKPNGEFKLGAMSPFPYCIFIIYLSTIVIASLKKYRVGIKDEGLLLITLSGCILAGVIMNAIFDFKLITPRMATLSCVFYYMFFVSQTYIRDALTGALNRHSFYRDTPKLIAKPMFIISMDLNGLKKINDTLGHSEGDKAIKAVADSAFSILPSNYKFYRMGGDEFAILCPKAKEINIINVISKLKCDLNSKNYSIAVGYAEFNPKQSFDSVFVTADENMYNNKVAMKISREIPNDKLKAI